MWVCCESAWMKSSSLRRAERAVVRKGKVGSKVPSRPEIYFLLDKELGKSQSAVSPSRGGSKRTADDKPAVVECIRRAMAQISNASCIRFVNTLDNKPPDDHAFIIFSVNLQPKRCSSAVGLDAGRQTFIRLGEKCGVQVNPCFSGCLFSSVVSGSPRDSLSVPARRQ